ncbi:hypothetical protein [Paraburkholderia sp. DHOC27]|uniref:hypothetical protein n=1 Tax=Paraburkholderia sp. DHOC27 TaxID=2303330 RepID=UPI0011C1000C|nr:hypothetical protein [Paraburkholderia sp. DHOC27]
MRRYQYPVGVRGRLGRRLRENPRDPEALALRDKAIAETLDLLAFGLENCTDEEKPLIQGMIENTRRVRDALAAGKTPAPH